MKTLTKLALVLIPTMALSLSATAHDPSLHVKKAEKADCSKMDMKNPVAIAMMKKCMKQSKADDHKMKEMDHSKMKKIESKAAKKDDQEHNH